LSLFEQALAKSGYRDINAGTLIHSDASLHNILVDQNTHQFKALFDPGPTIIGNPMFDLAYAAQPWKQGTNYMNTLVESYQQANGDFNETQFNLSLLCVAYQHVPYGIINTQAQTYIKENIFPRITNPSKQP
jgi:Ser/Thr protein kinase RdoA (MazF antagonist)